ncbi:uncharacterized protein V1513DRAFT_443024 [Lipomyces chichibuensis]|uniref:uncharacterized protein n=1 Tax=Lipomyces chichibuensis TaxID=1546026 RepID=UPI00334389B9
MTAEPQSHSSEDLLTPNSHSADTVPIPPLRSPKRSPGRARIASPLSEVPTNDSRRNSPSTADHQRYLLQQQKNIDTGPQDPLDSKDAGGDENIQLSPRPTHSVMTFWYDKERENSKRESLSRSLAIDSNPIINNRVRNSIFHQHTGTQRPLPSSPVMQSSKLDDEELFEEMRPASPTAEGIARSRHVALEKRSSLLSSTGSIRSKKVTFEMAPPQVVEFESTQDSPITPDAISEDSDEDENSERPLDAPNHVIDKPTSRLMKFESSFSPGVYLHRTLSGSRSLPKPSAHTFNTKSRPLPAVPTEQSNPSNPQKHVTSTLTEIRQSGTSLVRQDSVMSGVSEASSYDAMDLLDSYTFEDINIDNEQGPSNCDAENVEHANEDDTVSHSSVGTLMACEVLKKLNNDSDVGSKDDSDEQSKEDSNISNVSPDMSSIWAGDTPASSPHDVFDDIAVRGSNGYESIDLSKSRDEDGQTLKQHVAGPALISAHTRSDSSTSFKLELSFEAAENDFGSGLNDYLNSTSFLAKSWMDGIDGNPISVSKQRHDDIPAEDQTIKSSSGAKTRPSLAPADVVHMATTRRKVSGDQAKHKFLDLPSVVEDLPKPTGQEQLLLDLDNDDFSFDILSKEFDRVMEMQTRGYLMRQNTRIVYACADTDLNDSSERTYQPWTGDRSPIKDQTPPGNVSTMNNSMLLPETEHQQTENYDRKTAMIPDDQKFDLSKPSKQSPEAQRELPVATCNVQMKPAEVRAKPISVEVESTVDPAVDPADRGRLFVKVLALKDLKLPLNDDTSAYFALTLDNGIHCVTTAYMNLTRNAPIYQEFELIVGMDLEFILTLKAKITRPATPVSRPPSPKKKESRFGIDKLFSSPKRRMPAESVSKHSPLALDHLLGSDGSFARSYIAFSQIEKEVYLASKILEVPCYNEWATEFDASRSRKAERVTTAPYAIGKIVLQLLYYPKTHRNQEIPRSLNACLRELNKGRN